MTASFDATARNVLVEVVVVGPARVRNSHSLRYRGRNQTSVRPEFLRRLGFDLARATRFQSVGPPPPAPSGHRS